MVQYRRGATDEHRVMKVDTTPTMTLTRAPGVAVVAAVGAEQITIDGSMLTAIWLLLAVLGVVLAWALFELKRRRKAALRLDRLAGLSDGSRYPTATAHSREDFEALLDIISLDERLPAIVKRVEALSASHEVPEATTAPAEQELEADTPGS